MIWLSLISIPIAYRHWCSLLDMVESLLCDDLWLFFTGYTFLCWNILFKIHPFLIRGFFSMDPRDISYIVYCRYWFFVVVVADRSILFFLSRIDSFAVIKYGRWSSYWSSVYNKSAAECKNSVSRAKLHVCIL